MAKTRKRQEGAATPSESPEIANGSTPVGTSGRDEGENRSYADRVALRAYELYLARGASDGQDFDDWLTAEREVAGLRQRDDRDDPNT